MTYEADYQIPGGGGGRGGGRGVGGINPYGNKKAYTSQSDFYSSIMKLLYDFAQLRASNICKRDISKPC